MNIARLVFSPLRLAAVIVAAACFAVHSSAVIRYVDGSAPGPTHDGTSWNNAWTNVTAMTGLKAGDTVYISGGPKGSTQTYSFSGAFNNLPGYAEGAPGSPVTYQIGQDSLHNGKAIFKQTAVGSSYHNFIYGASNVIFSGDAGDGVKHFGMDPTGTSDGLFALVSPNVNVRFSYWDLGTFANIGSINTANGVELDHINIKVGNFPAADRAIYVNFTGSTWDDNKIHDCTIQLPYNPSNLNFGPDGIQGGGNGYSIYNNTISSYVDNTLTTTQHMDGIQVLGGNYIKAYGNVITNMTNYGMYWEAYFAVFNHLRVYDNVISVTDPVLGTGSSGGIVVEQKISGTMNDIVVANNTIADLQPSGSRTLTMLAHLSSYGHAYTNSVLANNALVNGNPPETDDGAPTPTQNVNVSAANAATYFTKYVKYGGASNDFHLTSLASSLINKGTNVASLIGTLDITNLLFGSSPSVGAYEYSGSVAKQAPSNATISVVVQ